MPDFPSLSPAEGGAKITSIFDFSPEVLGQLSDYIAQSGLAIPVSQVIGFSQTVPVRAYIGASDTTASTTYVDLAGPTITGLSNGKYLVIVSAYMGVDTNTGISYMAPVFNGSTPADSDAAICGIGNSNFITACNFSIATLSVPSGNNTITTKYKEGGPAGNATFANRNIVAIRMANA